MQTHKTTVSLFNTDTDDIYVGDSKFTFIDLFAGIGGFRLALEEYEGKCVYTSEWDNSAQVTYYTNFGDVPDGDITKVDEKTIPKHDVLCAGFPCQAFSISGKQKGFDDTRGTLFFDVARIAKYHQPKVLFLENVKNFVSHDNGNTFKTILKTLDEIGYNTFYKVLNASEYGAITSRYRVYIVAFRKDLHVDDFHFPVATNSKMSVKDILETNVDDSFDINRSDIHITKEDNQISNKSTYKPIQIGYINKGGQGERIYSTSGHAITLSAHGGGAASKTGAYLVNGKIRKLTPRECARVMGFPDTFKIPVSKHQAYKQFGNSVAVPVLKKIFKEIIKIDHVWQLEKNTQQTLGRQLQKEVLITRKK
jgi:DNA (cytosine-5)-methyltransferase 1